MRLFALSLTLAFLAVLGAAAHQSWPDWWWRFREPAPEVVFARRLQPFIQNSCLDCHDTATAKGGFALEHLPLPDPRGETREKWERVLTHVTQGIMPPVDAPQPAPERRTDFVTWLDRLLHPVDPDNPDPGRVVIRRLNREQYKNTVRDLFGVDFHPAADFPDDDSGYGFDHIGSVLSVSPLLVERYLAAAEQVATSVLPDPMPPPRLLVAPPADWDGGDDDGALYSNKTLLWKADVPVAGRYRLDLEVSQDAAGDEPARFALRVEEREIGRYPARGTRRKPTRHAIELDLPAGVNRVRISFLNDYYRAATDTAKAADRNFYLRDATLAGPYPVPGQAPPEPDLPDWIAPANPGEPTRAWFARVLAPVMRRAYRGPVSPAEVDRLADLAQRSVAQGDSPVAALQVALQAILISPRFLYVGDLEADPTTGGSDRRLEPLPEPVLAARLAYFLWNGPPDERLLALAESDRLSRELPAEITRLLADPRAERFVRSFAGQWLEVRNLPLRQPDPNLHPEWSPALATSMQEETLRFFADFLTNGRPVTELLTAGHSFVDARLAAYYGLPAPAGDGFQRVQLPADRRAGLLGQAGVLTVTSYPNRTSPVLRGKFVLEKILGTPPPPPPPNIPSLAEHGPDGAPQTLRERLELHRASPSCTACHALIDPIGFALENYDALGRRRETEDGHPVDSTGRMATGEIVRSPVELGALIATARRDEFHRNFARTLLTYALGRGLDYYDRPTVEAIVAAAEKRGHTLPAYIDAVIASVAFRQQRVEPADVPAARADRLAAANPSPR
ncbi:MAG: DUF1592 domain-containing protein [Verrucomicrobiota bacterium]